MGPMLTLATVPPLLSDLSVSFRLSTRVTISTWESRECDMQLQLNI